MKRILSLVLALAMLAGFGALCAVGEDEADGAEFPFGDVPASRWSNPYIVLMYNEGIVGGKSARVFAPADNIKRSEFVKILCGVAGADTEGAEHSFTDVVSGSWYEPYVAWAAEQGIVGGVAEGRFAPDALITRQDMATMIYRYVKNVFYPETPAKPVIPVIPILPVTPEEPPIVLPVEPKPEPEIMSVTEDGGDESGLPKVNEPVEFTDGADIAEYAVEAVSAIQQAGIIGGVGNSDGTFRFEPKNNATREQACKMLGELFLITNEDKVLPEPVAPNAFYIEYDLKGGKASSLKRVYNPAETFSLPIPTREGFTFLGWSGTGINGVELTHTVMAGSVTGDLRFVAKWSPIEYTITYDYNGGAEDISAPKTYNAETETFIIYPPKRDGYKFLGWTGTGLSSPTKEIRIKSGSTGNRSYKANWEPLSKQATAVDLLADWVDENHNYYFDGDNTVVVIGEYEGVEMVFGIIHRPPTYADPMRRIQLEYSTISDGICFTSIITLGTQGTPTVLCEVSDVSSGDVYMQSSELTLPKINEDMALNIYWKYNYLGNDPELLASVKELMLIQIIDSKAAVNEVYWNEIGRYGYDLSVFGL